MTYRWLTDLDVALDDWGVPYVPIMDWPTDYTGSGDWRTRGRPSSTGQFDPRGILCHHTASPKGTSDEADLNAILWGNGSAPGPISQLYIGRTGTVYLIAAGRANHGGQGIRPGVDLHGCADMNAALVGIEAGNAGTGAEHWSDALIEAYADVVAALAVHYGWRASDVYLHATTGPPGGGCNSKIDPAGPWLMQPDIGGATWSLDVWRQYVIDRGTTPPPPLPNTFGERRKGMSDFVVIYGIPDVADGTVLEVIGGKKRYVSGDEWWQVLKGVIAGPDGTVPPHDPWQPVATFTNGWYALGLPDFDDATRSALPQLDRSAEP